MAISPISPTFLQQSSKKRSRQNLGNFRVRTGQKFGDLAKTKFLEQELEVDLERDQQQARTALAFREQQERERVNKVNEAAVAAESRRQRKAEEFSITKTLATVAKAFT